MPRVYWPGKTEFTPWKIIDRNYRPNEWNVCTMKKKRKKTHTKIKHLQSHEANNKSEQNVNNSFAIVNRVDTKSKLMYVRTSKRRWYMCAFACDLTDENLAVNRCRQTYWTNPKSNGEHNQPLVKSTYMGWTHTKEYERWAYYIRVDLRYSAHF